MTHRLEHRVPIIDGVIAIGQVISMGLGQGEPLPGYSARYHALPPLPG